MLKAGRWPMIAYINFTFVEICLIGNIVDDCLQGERSPYSDTTLDSLLTRILSYSLNHVVNWRSINYIFQGCCFLFKAATYNCASHMNQIMDLSISVSLSFRVPFQLGPIAEGLVSVG